MHPAPDRPNAIEPRRSLLRLDLPQILVLFAFAGGVLIIVGSQVPWGRLDLPSVGPIPRIVITVDGSSPGRHGSRILATGIAILVLSAAGCLSRPFAGRARAPAASLLTALTSLVLLALSLYAALLAWREVQAIHDRGRLARDLHLGFLSEYASIDKGLPLIFAGAALTALASFAAALAALLSRNRE